MDLRCALQCITHKLGILRRGSTQRVSLALCQRDRQKLQMRSAIACGQLRRVGTTSSPPSRRRRARTHVHARVALCAGLLKEALISHCRNRPPSGPTSSPVTTARRTLSPLTPHRVKYVRPMFRETTRGRPHSIQQIFDRSSSPAPVLRSTSTSLTPSVLVVPLTDRLPTTHHRRTSGFIVRLRTCSGSLALGIHP